MRQRDLIHQLNDIGIHTKAHFYAEAFSRNIGLLTPAEQMKLSEATVAIPGMGGVGGVHLMTLIRMGIGKFHIADFDTFDAVNINRQYGAKVPNFGKNKLEIMRDEALSANPYADIRTFPEGITASNLDDFLDGVDVVVDGLDYFEFDIRRMLFNRAREKGIYVITAGPMGFSSALLIFSPHEGMGFDDYFNIRPGMTSEDHYLSYGLGLSPRPTQIRYMDLSRVDLSGKAGPSSIIACQLCAGSAANEAMRIILQRGKIFAAPYYFQFDPYRYVFRKGKLRGGNRNPLQKVKLAVVKKILATRQKTIKPVIPEIPRIPRMEPPLPESVLTYILRAGIQAPSGDNVQPWEFKIRENALAVHLDRAADPSFFNVNQIASTIACGAALENMKISGTLFGLEADIRILPEGKGSDLMASIAFKDENIGSDPLSAFIWDRCTNRKFYSTIAASEHDLRAARDAVSVFPGAKLHLVTDRDRLKPLARMVYLADRIRTEHRPLHEHLNRMIRFTRKEAIEKRDGFPLKNLEAGLAGEMFLKGTKSWPVMTLANHLGIGRAVAMHAKMSVTAASGVGLLTVPGTQTEDFLKGGQALERLWLTLTRLGISFQPMAAVNLFWMRWMLCGNQDFSPKHQTLLREAWRLYQELFPGIDFAAEGHVMLFRFGYANSIRQKTIRKEPTALLLEPQLPQNLREGI